MLTIRNAQLHAFEALDHERFAGGLAEHLAASHPSWFAACSEDEVAAFTKRAIALADGNAVHGRLAVATLAELLIEFGESFERSPDQAWARQILSHPTLPEQLKVPMLADRLRQRTGGRRVVEIEAS